MKFALPLLALFFTIASAQADYVPGRVRAGAVAEMEILEATGQYENVKSVMLYQNFMDGKGFVGFTAVVDGKKIEFTLTSRAENTGCGEVVAAQSQDNMSSAESSIFGLRDMSRALCERMIAAIWENVTIKTKNQATGEESLLQMQGNPVALMQTL